MKKWLTVGLIVSLSSGIPGAGAKTASEFGSEWQSLGFGLYIHYGIKTFDKSAGNDTELIKPSAFRPKRVDAQQWVKVAKAAGAKYVYLTVKHEYGFCLWDSEDCEYDIGSSPARKLDIIGDLIAACEAEGIKMGIHYSIADFFNEGALRKKGLVSPAYFDVIKRHVRELHTTYPGISIHRFDWASRISIEQRRELHELIGTLNPDCLVNTSLWPKKTGDMFEFRSPGLPEGGIIPRELFATIPKTKMWMWEPGCNLTPPMAVYRQFCEAKRNSANFSVGVAPDRSGRIPKDQLKILGELKKLIAETPPVAAAPRKTPKVSDGGMDRHSQEQLKKLKSLYESGLISKEIYDEKQRELVASLLAGGGSSSPVVQGSVNLKDGLVLCFGFNESSSFRISDESGFENHGKVRGAQWTKEGRIGGAYRFDQKKRTNGIRVEDSDSLDCTSVTVAAWIKTDDVGSGWTRIVDKDWKRGYNLTMCGTMLNKEKSTQWHGKAVFEFSDKRWIGTKRKVADGKWHYIVGTYGEGVARIYVDGKLDGEKKLNNGGPVKINDIDLMIGNRNPQHEKEQEPNAFDGLIDEVRIYNRVLNSREVVALFELNE